MLASTAMTEQQTPEDDPDPMVQMNVRVPKSVRDQLDARRAQIGKTGISRDKWVLRVIRFALAQPDPRRRGRTVARTRKGTSVKPGGTQ